MFRILSYFFLFSIPAVQAGYFQFSGETTSTTLSYINRKKDCKGEEGWIIKDFIVNPSTSGYSDPKIICYKFNSYDDFAIDYDVNSKGDKIFKTVKMDSDDNAKVNRVIAAGLSGRGVPVVTNKNDYKNLPNLKARDYFPTSFQCFASYCNNWSVLYHKIKPDMLLGTCRTLENVDEKFDTPCADNEIMTDLKCKGYVGNMDACQTYAKTCCTVCEDGYTGNTCNLPIVKYSLHYGTRTGDSHSCSKDRFVEVKRTVNADPEIYTFVSGGGMSAFSCPCKSNFVGEYCNYCRCVNGRCSLTGNCIVGSCEHFWKGEFCDICGCNIDNIREVLNGNCYNGSCRRSSSQPLLCSQGFWGPTCENTCGCNLDNSENGCDPETGKCLQVGSSRRCKAGFVGSYCDVGCDSLGTSSINENQCECLPGFDFPDCARLNDDCQSSNEPLPPGVLCRVPTVWDENKGECTLPESLASVPAALDLFLTPCSLRLLLSFEDLGTAEWIALLSRESQEASELMDTFVMLMMRVRAWNEWFVAYKACTNIGSTPSPRSIDTCRAEDPLWEWTSLGDVLDAGSGIEGSDPFAYRIASVMKSILSKVGLFNEQVEIPSVEENGDTYNLMRMVLDISLFERELLVDVSPGSTQRQFALYLLWPGILENLYSIPNVPAVDARSPVTLRLGTHSSGLEQPSVDDVETALYALRATKPERCELCPCDKVWDGVERCVPIPDNKYKPAVQIQISQHNLQCALHTPHLHAEYIRRALSCISEVEFGVESSPSSRFSLRVASSVVALEAKEVSLALSLLADDDQIYGRTQCEDSEEIAAAEARVMKANFRNSQSLSRILASRGNQNTKHAMAYGFAGQGWLESAADDIIGFVRNESPTTGSSSRVLRSTKWGKLNKKGNYSPWYQQTFSEPFDCEKTKIDGLKPPLVKEWEDATTNKGEAWVNKISPLFFTKFTNLYRTNDEFDAVHSRIDSSDFSQEEQRALFWNVKVLKTVYTVLQYVIGVSEPVLVGETAAFSDFRNRFSSSSLNSDQLRDVFTLLNDRLPQDCGTCTGLLRSFVEKLYSDLGVPRVFDETTRLLLQQSALLPTYECTLAIPSLQELCLQLLKEQELHRHFNMEHTWYFESSLKAASEFDITIFELRLLPVVVAEAMHADSQGDSIISALFEVMHGLTTTLVGTGFQLSSFVPTATAREGLSNLEVLDLTVTDILCGEEGVCRGNRASVHQLLVVAKPVFAGLLELGALLSSTLSVMFTLDQVSSSRGEWEYWNSYMAESLHDYVGEKKSKSLVVKEIELSRLESELLGAANEAAELVSHLCWVSQFQNPVQFDGENKLLCEVNADRLKRADNAGSVQDRLLDATNALIALKESIALSSKGYTQTTVALDLAEHTRYFESMKEGGFKYLSLAPSIADANLRKGAFCRLDSIVVTKVRTVFFDQGGEPITKGLDGEDIMIQVEWFSNAPWYKWTKGNKEVLQQDGFSSFAFLSTQLGAAMVDDYRLADLVTLPQRVQRSPANNIDMSTTAPLFGGWAGKLSYGSTRQEALPDALAKEVSKVVLYLDIAGVPFYDRNANCTIPEGRTTGNESDDNLAIISGPITAGVVVATVGIWWFRRHHKNK